MPNEDIIDKGNTNESEVVEEAKKEIDELKAEIKELKEEKKETKTINDEPVEAVVKTEKEKVESSIKSKRLISNGDFYSISPYVNGFKLINRDKTLEYKFLKTSLENIFITSFNDIKGVGFYDENLKSFIMEYDNAEDVRVIKSFKFTQ